MGTNAIYTPRRLQGLLRELAPRFYLPSEFPGRAPDKSISRLLDTACGLAPDAFESYSLLLKSSEIDSLILCLPNASESERRCIAGILKAHADKRILELLWPFYQYHFENAAVAETVKELLPLVPERTRSSTAYRNLLLFTAGDGFDAMTRALIAAFTPLAPFAAAEALLLQSPLAFRLLETYFSRCGKDGFLMNEKRLLGVLNASETAPANLVLINYLDRLDRTEFLPNVNNDILRRWGDPYLSMEWSVIPGGLRQKFVEWISYKRLTEHFVKNKLKLRILNDVVPYMRHVELSADTKFMAADFGEFMIADDNELSSYSYFIEKSLFEKLSVELSDVGIEEFKKSLENISNARDFMIDESEGSFMQLEYEDLGRLYIKDMLGIKLQIAPDLRPSKSLIRKKRRTRGTG